MGFKRDMLWGAATAAFQVEGAYDEEGRGLSVWDVFCERPDKIRNGDNGKVACDHFHRYKEDVKLLKELGVNVYRFSVSWTRILPDGIGRINKKGIEFYNNLIDELLSAGITPFVTLFHWNYPYALYKKGGWLNSESPKWFGEFARVVAENFGDRVKMFATFNEPQMFMWGHSGGNSAPGIDLSPRELTEAGFNVLLAHGEAVRVLRECVPDCKVGCVICTGQPIPQNDAACKLVTEKEMIAFPETGWVWNTQFWADAIYRGDVSEIKDFQPMLKYLPDNYETLLKEKICMPLDYCGINVYQGTYFKADENGNILYSQIDSNTPKSALAWNITPDVLYWCPKMMYKRYGLPIIVAENGMACNDLISSDGAVHDPARIDFMEKYIKELERSAQDGTEVAGYIAWSFMDNFEWTEGYWPRFGLVFVDYATQKRVPKDSFYFYRNYIESFKKH